MTAYLDELRDVIRRLLRARDATLKRDVAIKVLPEFWSRDPDRLRRFEQEAQATAVLFAGRLRLGGRQFGILPQLAVILHVVGCGPSDHLSEVALDDMQSQIDARGKSGGG